jgi:hypothetical protein
MQIDRDSSQDDLSSAFARMFGMGGGMAQAADLWRTMCEAMIAPRTADVGRDTASPASNPLLADPVALMIRVNSLLLSSSVRYWLRWQEVLSTHAPALRRSLEEIGSGKLSSTEARDALLHNLRSYLRDVAALPFEHCRRFQEELRGLEEAFFADTKLDAPRRFNKCKD